MKNNIPTITVNPELRELILPSEKLVLGINGDVEVNTVQFQLPLIYRDVEMKNLTPRVNYVNPNGDANYYESTMESDESNCYFIWPIAPDITAYTGHVRFSLTLYQTEGGAILHKFNTRSAVGRVYTGFEAEKQVTPEQQQTLLSKLETQIKADLNDHTEKLKGELTEKGKEILDGFGESGNASEELKTIKQDLGTKLTAPPTPEPGKILKIKSVNEDGTFTCEWADGGSNLDVRINGESIVQDGVAEIPAHKGRQTRNNFGTVIMGVDGDVTAYRNTSGEIGYRYLPLNSIDMAVKAAMCDGKGAAWTADEQAAARERMGIDEWEDVITYTTSSEEENSTICYIDFEHTYKKIYVLIDESTIENTTYMTVRFGVIGKNKLHNVSLLANTSPAFNVKNKYKTFSAEVMNTADVSYQYAAANSVQLYSYAESPFIGRTGYPSVSATDVSAIGGIMWYGKMYAGTVITVKGVRA